MARFLIDENLPYYFSLWNGDEFIHLLDVGIGWTDNQIWEYALSNDLIIITKDADFFDRVILKGPPPKVIHIRFGNLKMRQFFEVISNHWEDTLTLLESNRVVSIYRDRIEAIE